MRSVNLSEILTCNTLKILLRQSKKAPPKLTPRFQDKPATSPPPKHGPHQTRTLSDLNQWRLTSFQKKLEKVQTNDDHFNMILDAIVKLPRSPDLFIFIAPVRCVFFQSTKHFSYLTNIQPNRQDPSLQICTNRPAMHLSHLLHNGES